MVEQSEVEADFSIGTITWAVLSAVFRIALLVLVGVKLEHQGVLNNVKRKALSALAMDVCLPCLLFSRVLPEADWMLLLEGWELLLWPLVYAFVSGSIMVLVAWLGRVPSDFWGTAAACAAFPNVNGFPVSIIAALGSALPPSAPGPGQAGGVSALTFLAIIQLTDGMVKYTIGPQIFKRDLRIARARFLQSGEHHEGDIPIGGSIYLPQSHVPQVVASPEVEMTPTAAVEHGRGSFRSILGPASGPFAPDHVPTPQVSTTEAPASLALTPSGLAARRSSSNSSHSAQRVASQTSVQFGEALSSEQCKTVQPEWSRAEAGWIWSFQKFWSDIVGVDGGQPPQAPSQSSGRDAEGARPAAPTASAPPAPCSSILREVFPPQVTGVLLALATGLLPQRAKHLLCDPGLKARGGKPPLGFVYDAAYSLGGGFVPLQMISLGGRYFNIVGENGPFAAKGSAGPEGRRHLLFVSAAVAVVRMLVSPFVLYFLAHFSKMFLLSNKPTAFWAPALIVSAMPTANNISLMADLIGSGRSISAATTALQLLASPMVLAVTLTLLILAAGHNLGVEKPAEVP